jgi:hypothetical protein
VIDPALSVLPVHRLRIVLARIGVTCNTSEMLEQRMARYFDRAAQQARPVLWSFLSSLPGADPIGRRAA